MTVTGNWWNDSDRCDWWNDSDRCDWWNDSVRGTG